MKKALIVLGVLGIMSLGTASTVRADHRYHGAVHDLLAHRSFHRQLYHDEAHRYPMSWYGHERLHDRLEHDAFHDQLEHAAYHRSFGPRRFVGFRLCRPGLSLSFGF